MYDRKHMNLFERDLVRLPFNQTLVTASMYHKQDLFQRANDKFRGWRDLALRTPEYFNTSGPGGIIGLMSKTLAIWLRHTACWGGKRQQYRQHAPQLPMDFGGWVSKFVVLTRHNFLYAARCCRITGWGGPR